MDNTGKIIAKVMDNVSQKKSKGQAPKPAEQAAHPVPAAGAFDGSVGTSPVNGVDHGAAQGPAPYGAAYGQAAVCPVCAGRGIVLEGDTAVPCACMEQKRIENSFKHARMSRELKACSFEGFKLDYYKAADQKDHYLNAQKALKAARDFTAAVQSNPHEVGLLFSGPVGSGKTFLAASIANALLEKGHTVLFLIVPDLLDELRASFSSKNETSESDLLDVARTVPILILDDLGAHNYTEWTRNRIYSILNYRMNEQLPTVITTNLDFADIEQYLGERTCSRLLQMCRIFRLTASQDIRRQKYIEREKLKERQ